MAKAAKVLCDRCEFRITAGVSFCPNCRYPTRWASHEERTTWELSQWKAGKEASKKADPKRSGRRGGRWMVRPFARKKAAEPEWHLSLVPAPVATLEAEAEEAATPPVAPARVEEREPATVAPAVKLAPKPVEKPHRPVVQVMPAAEPKPAAVRSQPGDNEPAKDTPNTVLAMRLLNAKVAELEDRIARLERELAEARREQPVAR